MMTHRRGEKQARQWAKARGRGQINQVAGDQYNILLPQAGREAPIIQIGDATLRLTFETMPALCGLPPASVAFTGRSAELEDVLAALDPARTGARTALSALVGLGGMGKTELALQAADTARTRGWFPGGVLFIDLFGYDPLRRTEPGAALDALLRGLGVPAEAVPPQTSDRARLYVTVLAAFAEQGRRVLVVLDNASSAEQVRPLLPSDGTTGVIITSRHTLSTLDARLVELSELDDEAAVGLLDGVLNTVLNEDARVADEPAAARRIARLCAGLPLALRIIAALLVENPGRPLSVVASDLADERTRLDELQVEDLAVRAAFDLSYRHLTEGTASMFRLVALHPGQDISVDAAAALSNCGRSAARRTMEALARGHLLERASVHDRWRFHDLVRIYAGDLSIEHDGHDRRTEALHCLLDYYGENTAAAAKQLRPTRAAQPQPGRFEDLNQALGWLDDERANLTAIITAAHGAGRWQNVCALAGDLEAYLELRHATEDWLTIGELAVNAADHLASKDWCRAAAFLGNAYRVAQRLQEAVQYLGQALERVAQDDRIQEGRILHNLGLAHFLMGDYTRAESCHRRDHDICTAAEDWLGAAQSMVALGDALRGQRRYREAVDILDRAITILTTCGDVSGTMTARINLAVTWLNWRPKDQSRPVYIIWQLCAALEQARELGDRHAEATIYLNLGAAYRHRCPICYAAVARDWSSRAATLFAATGDLRGVAKTHVGLAESDVFLGDSTSARDHLRQALDIFTKLGANEQADDVRQLPDIGDCVRHDQCQDQRVENAATRAWLEDLPHAILRGEHQQLDGCVFIQPSPTPPTLANRENTPRGHDPDLTPLTTREALDRLQELTGLKLDPGSQEIASALGHRPLALAQAAATIRREHINFADYTGRLHAIRIDALSTRSALDQRIAASILLNLESLQECAPHAAEVAETLSIFASANGVDFRLMRLSATPHDTLSLDSALDHLIDAALAKPGSSVTSAAMHPRIQQVIREWSRRRGSLLPAAERVLHALSVEFGAYMANTYAEPYATIRFSEHIDALWAAVAPSMTGPRWPGLIDLMELRTWQISHAISMTKETDLGTAGEEVAAAASSAGEELLADCDRHLGLAHTTTRHARNHLAHAYRAMGQHDRACALFAKNLRYTDRPDDAPDTLATRHDLGLTQLQAGRPKRAQQILSDVLTRRERVLGTDHPDTCETRRLLETARSLSR